MRFTYLLFAALIAPSAFAITACELDNEEDEVCGEEDEDEDEDDDGDEEDGDENCAQGATTGSGSNSSTGASSTVQSCDAYCDSIMASCSAANAQYETREDCVAVCQFFPEGTAGDDSGNSRACRLAHADGGSASECRAAGPGGDGVCGDNCAGFCQLATGACTGANLVYASEAECMSDCEAHGTDVPYDVSKDSGNEVSCLLAHATGAPLVPEDHCVADLNASSDTCK